MDEITLGSEEVMQLALLMLRSADLLESVALGEVQRSRLRAWALALLERLP